MRALVAVAIDDNAPEVSFDTTRVSVREGGTARLTVSVEQSLAEPTELRYVLGTDDNVATGDADADDHDGRDGTVTIPAGETRASFEIAIHDDRDIEPAREVLAVKLVIPPDQPLASGDLTAVVVIEEGVCDRSALVRDELRGERHCADVSPADLADVYLLNLQDRDWAGPLRAGDLSGLTGTFAVRLNQNRLTALPETVFAGMEELSHLLLTDNDLANLPPGLFRAIPRLDRLFLDGNALRTLPAGILSGLSFRELDVAGNPGAPFPLKLEWARPALVTGPDSVMLVASLPVGAPFAIEARVSAANAHLSTDTVVVPAGGIESSPILVTRTGKGVARVAFDTVSPVPDRLCRVSDDYAGLVCFRGLETLVGEDFTFSPPRLPTELFSGERVSLPLSRLFRVDSSEMRTFTAVSSDPALASVAIADGKLTISSPDDGGAGTVTVTVIATGGDGTSTERVLRIRVEPQPRSLLRGWRRTLLEQLRAADRQE